jgi:hypothetical protein
MRLVFTVLFPLFGSLASADDLVTRTGEVHHDYQVVSYDAGFLTIMDSDGGARIPLADLPPGLQRQYHYDPVVAAQTVAQFNAQNRQEKQAVEQAETAPGGASGPVVADTASAAPPSPSATPSSQVLAPVPPATPADVTAPVASTSTSFDPGFDPMSPDAPVLESKPQDDDTPADSQQDSYTDPDGVLWFGSPERDGTIRWVRAERAAQIEQLRLEHSDLPPGAMAMRDGAGRWMVTYVDRSGHVQRIYRPEFDRSLHEGSWKVFVNPDGSRSLRLQDSPHQPASYHAHEYFAGHSTGSTSQRPTGSNFGHTQTTGGRVASVPHTPVPAPSVSTSSAHH